MSTTRSQKKTNVEQESTKNVSEGSMSPVLLGNEVQVDQDVMITCTSNAKSPRIENSVLEGLRASLRDEITSEIKNLLAESQREMLKLLKSKINGSVREDPEDDLENGTRNFYTPTKLVKINSTQNNDSNVSRHIHSVAKFQKIEGWILWGTNSKKKYHNTGKTDRGDSLVLRGIVCYPKKGKSFLVQFPGPTDTIWRLPSNFVELLVELFWSLHVYRKKLTKSHDSKEKFRLKIKCDWLCE